MNFFNFDIKKVLIIIFLVIIPVFFFTLSRTTIQNNPVFKSLMLINSKMQSAYQSVNVSVKNTVNTYVNIIHTKKTNRMLIKKNNLLKSHYSVLQEVKQENKRLNNILNFKKNYYLDLIPARIIGRDPISKYQLMTINRGSIHGLKKKMLVITKRGVVGYIFRVLSDFSQIILLTDHHAAIHAVVQRSRVYGIIEGVNKTILKLNYLKRRDDVKIGDIIVTSGLSSLAYKGLPIGIVTFIKKQQYGITQEITITPFVNYSQIEEVFIVNKKLSL